MTDIVVTDIPPREQITSGGGTGPFNYPFAVFAQTDLNVYLTPAGTVPSDLTNILTYNVQYTVIINPAPAVGGSITLVTASTAGDIITIVRNMPDDRLNNYIAGGLFQATDVNTDFDRTVFMAQQNKMYDTEVGVHYNLSASPVPVVDTVLPVLPANAIWIKAADNSKIIAVTTTGTVNPYSVALPTTDNAIARFDGVAGSLQNSGVIISDTNDVTGIVSLRVGNLSLNLNQIASVLANGSIQLAVTGAGSIQILSGKSLRFFEPTNTNYTGLKAGANVASLDFALPIADGTAGQSLQTDGAGNLSFGDGPWLQQVRTVSVAPANTAAIIPADNTIPQIGEGTELITVTITPKSAASTLMVEFYCPLVGNAVNQYNTFALFRDAGANALTAGMTTVIGVSYSTDFSLKFYVASGAAVATTFRIRYGTTAGTIHVLESQDGTITFGGVPQLSLTVTEIV